MALTVEALRALLDEADPASLVILARFDGDEVHADAHIAEDGKVVLREQGREFALVELAAAAAEVVVEQEGAPVELVRDRIHEVIAQAAEPVKPIRELRKGEFADEG